jgi:hypothetical protein
MQERTIRYIHPKVGDGRATIAYEEMENHDVIVTVAYCSPKDQFTRKIGRAIASGRLVKKNEADFVITYHERPSLKQITMDVVSVFFEFTLQHGPRWAKQHGPAVGQL